MQPSYHHKPPQLSHHTPPDLHRDHQGAPRAPRDPSLTPSSKPCRLGPPRRRRGPLTSTATSPHHRAGSLTPPIHPERVSDRSGSLHLLPGLRAPFANLSANARRKLLLLRSACHLTPSAQTPSHPPRSHQPSGFPPNGHPSYPSFTLFHRPSPTFARVESLLHPAPSWDNGKRGHIHGPPGQPPPPYGDASASRPKTPEAPFQKFEGPTGLPPQGSTADPALKWEIPLQIFKSSTSSLRPPRAPQGDCGPAPSTLRTRRPGPAACQPLRACRRSDGRR